MAHENADKDPDLRKKSDAEADAALLPPKPKWWQARWVLRVSPLVVFVLLVLAGWAGLSLFNWWAGDGSDGAAAGAWASAFGATALAIASVWLAAQANAQARKAEQRADAEAAKAEARHKNELEAAEKRLIDELDAQRRHQQLMSITPVWSTSTLYVDAAGDLVKHYPLTAGHSRDHSTHIEAGRIFRRWREIYGEMSNTFIEPNLLVTDRETRAHLSELQDACGDLKHTMTILQVSLEATEQYDTNQIEEAKTIVSRIFSARTAMLISARKNIAKVPALSDQEAEDLSAGQGE
ncbi:hypothetical protein [Rhodococcus rhodochrous]|uniref:hypothetical protein n=1 Tax=Rhodococcus rhodochrous TaxID=1829 RepID=UPI00177FC3A9|nr:hypothetical protein [Rhodococcus rhodochrous]QOH56228.1 hypothetical protein C6Y44_09830 [Rhodococcus rhodochrous]